MGSQFDLDLRKVHVRFKFNAGDSLVIFVGDDTKEVAASVLPSDVPILRDFFANWTGMITIETKGTAKVTKA